MKTLNEKFTDEEYEKLKLAKDGKSWHDFILERCLEKKKEDINLWGTDLDINSDIGLF